MERLNPSRRFQLDLLIKAVVQCWSGSVPGDPDFNQKHGRALKSLIHLLFFFFFTHKQFIQMHSYIFLCPLLVTVDVYVCMIKIVSMSVRVDMSCKNNTRGGFIRPCKSFISQNIYGTDRVSDTRP